MHQLNLHKATKIEVKRRDYTDDGFSCTSIFVHIDGADEPLEIAIFSDEGLVPLIEPVAFFPQDPTAGVLP